MEVAQSSAGWEDILGNLAVLQAMLGTLAITLALVIRRQKHQPALFS